MFDINKFNSETNTGFLNTSNFLAEITPPPSMQGVFNVQEMTFLCNRANHPAIRVLTDRVTPYGYGQTVLMPYGTITEDTVNFDFYIDARNVKAVKVFHHWVQQVAGIRGESLDSLSVGGLLSGEVQYREKYLSTIRIVSFDKEGNTAISTNLYEVFPVMVSEVINDWSSDDVSRLQVSFAFNGLKIETNTIDLAAGTSTESKNTPNYSSGQYASNQNEIRKKNELKASTINTILGSASLISNFIGQPISSQLNTLQSAVTGFIR